VLEIRDFGRGLPAAVMDRFQRTGTGSGVGLAGIRERIKELGGDFTICSSSEGTTLRSSVPLTSEARPTQVDSVAIDELPAPQPSSKNLAGSANRIA
jgi:signal transduction histidine kinase